LPIVTSGGPGSLEEVDSISGTQELTFRSFGVRARVLVPSGQLGRVLAVVPPGSTRCEATDLDATFALAPEGDGTFELGRDGARLAGSLGLELALEVLERELRMLVAFRAPRHIFVHAGVVAHRGAAAVMPGATMAGKTTLVAALVRAGADYYSDEFAPLDEQGLVHPFAKPLSLRDDRSVQTDRHVVDLGGVAGKEPVPVGAVIVTQYQAGVEWRPRRLTSGAAVLALMAHTVPAQSRPAQALHAINRAVDRATVIDAPRGEADAVAPLVLVELERAVSQR
jgi:hypothetical protein